MFSKRFGLDDEQQGLTWADLNQGAPTIIALAHLSSVAMAHREPPEWEPSEFSDEAKTILVAARGTGSICIRGDPNAFEPSERFLAVCVQLDQGRRIEFRCAGNPEQTVRFMDGLRQLCQAGLVMHQLMNDFSLTAPGFQFANSLQQADWQNWLEFGTETL